MKIKDILEKEQNNHGKIYLYMDEDKAYCRIYEFSAYAVTRLFPSAKLEEEFSPELGVLLFTVRLPLRFMARHSLDYDADTVLDNDCIKIIPGGTYATYFTRWGKDFEKLKEQREIDCSTLGKGVLGCFHLAKDDE